MMEIRFDVNDPDVRETFLRQQVMRGVESLGPDDPARWGKMSPQHMIEHLQWAFECSTGALIVPCKTPPQLLERGKRFLHDNRPTPREFRSPLLGDLPPPFRFADLESARNALRIELERFLRLAEDEPGTLHTHPIFGPLNGDEWHRAHFKHCYHHLLQFGVIADREGPPSSR